MRLPSEETNTKSIKSEKAIKPKETAKLMTQITSDPNWNSHDGALTGHYEGEGDGD